MTRWGEIKCPRCEELETENATLKQMWWDAGDVTDLAGTIADLEAKLAAERERIISVYRKLSTGSTVGAGDGGTLVVQYVDPEQFAAAIREGGE